MAYFDKQKMSDGTVVDVHDTEGRAIADANLSAAKIELNNTITTKVNKETTAREQADTTLQNNITAEQTARENAIEAEKNARISADNTLKTGTLQNQNPRKIAFIGDSIAEGYGWWNGVPANKNNNNDGFAPYFRHRYPNSQVDNFAVSGATVATGFSTNPSIMTQLPLVTNYDVVFVCIGVNDYTLMFNGKVPADRIGQLPDGVFSFPTDQSKTYSAFTYLLQSLQQQNPNAVIYFIAVNSSDGQDYMKWFAHMDNLKRICKIMGVPVFDCDKHIPRYDSPNGSKYYMAGSRVHYNQLGYSVLSPALYNTFMTSSDECEMITDILLTADDASITGAINSLFNIYKLWWFDGAYRVSFVKTSENFGLLPVVFTSNGPVQNVYAMAANGPVQFTVTDGTVGRPNYCIINTMVSDSPTKLIYIVKKPGIYVVPSNKITAITDLPAQLKTSSKGNLNILAISENSGIIYTQYADSDGAFYFFTFVNKNPAFWKLTATQT